MGATASCVAPVMSVPDAGAHDAGMGGSMMGGGTDAGTSVHDAGHAFVGDGGVALGDAAPVHTPGGHMVSGGCSVSHGERASGAWLVMLVLGLVAPLRRRRK